MLAALEPLFRLLERNAGILNGFVMVGVLMVLFGIQNVTRKDLKEYFRRKRNMHKADYIIAWSIFYVIFGILIAISSILTITLYT